ncbi:hypothetical protein FGO68_gene6685 [Halteria grandinella]|uniref:Uncharacterized protein n=1 Tax=Halteria grandinella TaxID=5974 RepID=A0A8J8NU22_HALGN|nr:hypothetical protein FGO68_gene6685 [Halteria grandinella]
MYFCFSQLIKSHFDLVQYINNSINNKEAIFLITNLSTHKAKKSQLLFRTESFVIKCIQLLQEEILFNC